MRESEEPLLIQLYDYSATFQNKNHTLMAAPVMIVSIHLRSKTVTHVPTDRTKGKHSHCGFVFSRRKHFLSSGIFVKTVFASMACARKQMTVGEENAILSMHRQGYSSINIQQMQLYNFQT